MTSNTQAKNFLNQFQIDVENNGYTGKSISRHPNAEEAKEEGGNSFWHWIFNDGSTLTLVPGQMVDSIYLS